MEEIEYRKKQVLGHDFGNMLKDSYPAIRWLTDRMLELGKETGFFDRKHSDGTPIRNFRDDGYTKCFEQWALQRNSDIMGWRDAGGYSSVYDESDVSIPRA